MSQIQGVSKRLRCLHKSNQVTFRQKWDISFEISFEVAFIKKI